MADIFGSTEENNYIDVTKRDSAAETMEMVIAGTGGYSTPSYDNENRGPNETYQKIISNNKLIGFYEKKIAEQISNHYTESDIEKGKIRDLKEENKSLENQLGNSIKYQLDPNNLVSSETEHRIHDGQKRYKTLGKTTSSKYPRPKTLFKVFFKPNEEMGPDEPLCNELSKFVMSVTKPDVQYTTKEMNQYNRKKYIIEGVKYGQLKITFIDVKDNPIQQAFFAYLRNNNDDFKNTYDSTNDSIYIKDNKGNFIKDENGNNKISVNEKTYRKYYENNVTHFDDVNWGLNINSSKHMFNSITICEMFLDRLMVYKIENPTLKSITFGENKMGDYGYNEITVAFDVEGITNIFNDINGSTQSFTSSDGVVGKQIALISGTEFGSQELAEALGMRWYQGSGASEDDTNDFISVLNSYDNAGIRNYSIQKTKDLLSKVNENIELEDYINEIDKSFKMGNNASQYNWFAEAGYYSDNQQQVLQAGYSSKDYGYTGPRKTYYELSRNNEELAELGRANDSEYSSGNALDALLGVVKNPQDVSKMFSPRIKQLTDYFKF